MSRIHNIWLIILFTLAATTLAIGDEQTSYDGQQKESLPTLSNTETGATPIEQMLLLPLEIAPPIEVVVPTPEQIHALRVKKCELIIRTYYNHGYWAKRNGTKVWVMSQANFLPHVEYFISYHEALEKKNPTLGKGFGNCWFWSAVYGAANFSLRCYATAPGFCAGPLDVKHSPLVTDPEANIRWHTNEMFGFYKDGVRGIRLCKCVFYPAAPHDWGGGRFAKTSDKFTTLIDTAYKDGRLP